jgi:hypothetical protein
MTQLRSRLGLAVALALASTACAGFAADPPGADMPAEHALSAAGVVGAQIAARNTKGIKPAVLQCMLDLPLDAFVPMLREQLTLALTPDELAVTEAAYGGPTRDRILRYGVAMAYRSRGMAPPGGDVVFSATEAAELDRFAMTSAGDKLYRQGILLQPKFVKIREKYTFPLFKACKDKGEAEAASAP